MERDDIAGRSCEIGEKVSKRFNEWKEKYPVIGDVICDFQKIRYDQKDARKVMIEEQ